MAVIGKYCKAYPLKSLRQYEQWTEELENVREETQEIDGKQVQIKRDLSNNIVFFIYKKTILLLMVSLKTKMLFLLKSRMSGKVTAHRNKKVLLKSTTNNIS
ncbi:MULTISPECIES: hypothetical protein [Crocosphaera]|uniref:hypothetical protein n=1 Tax=Crocosphaera TaxID=263510 RepID=UPI00258A5C25|nr:hypothetical protein [Crocosphaera sp.]MCH2244534.1 hypothetical protein [Crocosphaera sp.]